MSFGAHKDDDTLPIMTTTRNGQTDRRTDSERQRGAGRGRGRKVGGQFERTGLADSVKPSQKPTKPAVEKTNDTFGIESTHRYAASASASKII